MNLNFEVLSDREIEKVHEASLRVLERTGMRFASQKVLEKLAAVGAMVDYRERTARFPPRIVEEAIAGNRTLLRGGKRLHLLNGVTSELTGRDRIRAKVSGGCISGILDMGTGVVSFSAPEAIIQDIAIAEVHQRLYGFDFLIGSGYTDAKYPNAQLLAEKTAKFLLTYLSGRASYPVGLINGGSVFSDAQCLVDIELCRYIHGHFEPFGDFSSIDELVDLIGTVGSQGNYVAEDHTLRRFRESWIPQLFDRTGFSSIEESRTRDIYRNARESLRRIYSKGDFWQIDPPRARAIDEVVARAEREL